MRYPLTFFLFFLIFSVLPLYAANQESLTITTYYPSPHGVYRELIVHSRSAVGDTDGSGEVDNDDLAHDDSGNPIDGILTVGAGIGIGTVQPSVGAQALKLDVEGAVGATHYCDAKGNKCMEPPLGGDFGGMYTLLTFGLWPVPGTPNPYTGSCSCPEGYNTLLLTGYYPMPTFGLGWIFYCWK